MTIDALQMICSFTSIGCTTLASADRYVRVSPLNLRDHPGLTRIMSIVKIVVIFLCINAIICNSLNSSGKADADTTGIVGFYCNVSLSIYFLATYLLDMIFNLKLIHLVLAQQMRKAVTKMNVAKSLNITATATTTAVLRSATNRDAASLQMNRIKAIRTRYYTLFFIVEGVGAAIILLYTTSYLLLPPSLKLEIGMLCVSLLGVYVIFDTSFIQLFTRGVTDHGKKKKKKRMRMIEKERKKISEWEDPSSTGDQEQEEREEVEAVVDESRLPYLIMSCEGPTLPSDIGLAILR